jgi:hypothetical protein
MEKGTVYQQCTDEEIKNALEETGGIISPAARILGIARSSLQTRLKHNLELKEFQKECVEETKDIVESELIKAIKKGESWALTYYSKTQMRDRGYGDETTLNVNSINANVNLEFDLNRLPVEEVAQLYELISRAKLENEPPNTLPIGKESL